MRISVLNKKPNPCARIGGKPRPCVQRREKPVACITMGYPAGIGPEVIAGALASPKVRRLANFLIVGDGWVFKKALQVTGNRLQVTGNKLQVAGSRFRYRFIKSSEEIDFLKSDILFLDRESVSRKNFSFGKLDSSYGKASVGYIEKAVSLIKSKKADILVTAPIHKEAAQLSGFRFQGHTEYLADLTDTKDFAMMFKGGPLKIALVTTHLPLKEVSQKLSQQKIFRILNLVNAALKRYFILKRPCIAVCGLNPHAGEGGLLGDEESTVILPAIEKAAKKGVYVFGPLASDSVFYDLLKGRYDCAVCMYHDQGLVALKMIARDEAVNITLGLPFIRTSPAHGTALDIAGKNIASCESMIEAIRVAVSMFMRAV